MPTRTKLLLIDFIRNTTPGNHPQILPYLHAGWIIQSMEYRLLGARIPKLVVRLITPAWSVDGHGLHVA